MAVALGKRKRRSAPENNDDVSNEDDATARALFQRAFEAKFKPLEQSTKTVDLKEEPSEESSSEDDWSGLSNEDEKVEVVQVQELDSQTDDATRARELKAFMSGRIPSSTDQGPQSSLKQDEAEDKSEVANLKNDLALQRLLKESHLLDSSSYTLTGVDVEGKSRLKALDLRIQDLGGKTSHLSQKNMPLSHRRGIETKATSREQKRRKEATENGIILERAKFAAKSSKPREKGIGGPTVGKFQGGMLKLSSKDLRSIESTRTSVRGRKRSRGR